MSVCLDVENRHLEECFSHLRFGSKPIISFSPEREMGAMYTAEFSGKLKVTRNENDKLD